MRLSRKKAIELCIELWTWLAETGKHKEQWPEWVKYTGHYIESDCWFCEYDRQRRLKTKERRCYHCLFVGSLEISCVKNYYYGKWANAETPQARKEYAKLFLEQIKRIK